MQASPCNAAGTRDTFNIRVEITDDHQRYSSPALRTNTAGGSVSIEPLVINGRDARVKQRYRKSRDRVLRLERRRTLTVASLAAPQDLCVPRKKENPPLSLSLLVNTASPLPLGRP